MCSRLLAACFDEKAVAAAAADAGAIVAACTPAFAECCQGHSSLVAGHIVKSEFVSEAATVAVACAFAVTDLTCFLTGKLHTRLQPCIRILRHGGMKS